MFDFVLMQGAPIPACGGMNREQWMLRIPLKRDDSDSDIGRGGMFFKGLALNNINTEFPEYNYYPHSLAIEA